MNFDNEIEDSKLGQFLVMCCKLVDDHIHLPCQGGTPPSTRAHLPPGVKCKCPHQCDPPCPPSTRAHLPPGVKWKCPHQCDPPCPPWSLCEACGTHYKILLWLFSNPSCYFRAIL